MTLNCYHDSWNRDTGPGQSEQSSLPSRPGTPTARSTSTRGSGRPTSTGSLLVYKSGSTSCNWLWKRLEPGAPDLPGKHSGRPVPNGSRTPLAEKPTSSRSAPGREPGSGSSSKFRRSFPVLGVGFLEKQRRHRDQGSSAFFWEMRRRTRSARSAPSNGFLKPSLKPSEKVSSPGSSLVKARRIVP